MKVGRAKRLTALSLSLPQMQAEGKVGKCTDFASINSSMNAHTPYSSLRVTSLFHSQVVTNYGGVDEHLATNKSGALTAECVRGNG